MLHKYWQISRRKVISEPVSIAQFNEAELRCGVDDQVFGYATHMGHSQAGPHEKLDDKVAIADSPHTVFSQ